MLVKFYFYVKLIQLSMHQSYPKKIAKKLLLIQKVYLIELLKKEAQVFEILKISLEKVETSKKNLKFIKEKT